MLVLSVDPALFAECARMAAESREAGLSVEVYGGDDKLGRLDGGGVPVRRLPAKLMPASCGRR